jgi:hypothetical protein
MDAGAGEGCGVRFLAFCLVAVATISCAPRQTGSSAPVTFLDKADGFSITLPAHWTTKPISHGSAYAGVLTRSPDYDRTGVFCEVTASHDPALGRTQEDLNNVAKSGHLMHVTARMAKRGLAVQSGKAVQFAKGILGFMSEGTQRIDHLFGQSTDRFEALQVLIPEHGFVVSCFAGEADFPAHRKAFDQTIASFKLIAFK